MSSCSLFIQLYSSRTNHFRKSLLSHWWSRRLVNIFLVVPPHSLCSLFSTVELFCLPWCRGDCSTESNEENTGKVCLQTGWNLALSHLPDAPRTDVLPCCLWLTTAAALGRWEYYSIICFNGLDVTAKILLGIPYLFVPLRFHFVSLLRKNGWLLLLF